MGMRCSVVIPCFNGAELTTHCIESLLEQTGDHELEILLVDNASTDTTPSLANLHPCVRVLRQTTNLGFAGGVNVGLRAAQHEFVLIQNNDTRAATNLLTELHRALVSGPQIGAVAPVSNHVKGPARIPVGHTGRERDSRAQLAKDLALASPPLLDTDTLAGLCLLMRRATFAEIGLFDERFGHGNFEDDDLCLRLRLAGYRLVIARHAFLHHEGHATFRAMGLQIESEIVRRRAQFEAKWQADPAGQTLLAAARGDLAAAAAAARRARGAWPLWADADWHLARGCSLAGDIPGAAAHFAALLRACPFHSDAAVELILHRLASEPDVVPHNLLAWTSNHCHLTDEHQLRLWKTLGLQAYRQRNWPAAIANLQQAAAIATNEGELHNLLGTALLEDNQLETAIAVFTRAIELDFPLAHTNRGIAHHRCGQVQEALLDLRIAHERLPDNAIARNNLAALEARVCQSAALQAPRRLDQRAASTRPTGSILTPEPASAIVNNSSTMRSMEALGTQPIA